MHFNAPIIIYIVLCLIFFIYMTLEKFWKTTEITPKIFYSIFWPITLTIIYILINKKRKEMKK
jgi:L-asparagine transporter-like permease